MVTKAVPVKLGPFTGGLNTFSDQSTIADDECYTLNNFDVNLDGALISRPPIVLNYNVIGYNSLRYLGFYVTATGTPYMIYSGLIIAAERTIAINGITGAIVVVSGAYAATCVVTYQNKAYIIADANSASNSGSWDGTTLTAIAGFGKGNSAVVYKERIFVSSGEMNVTNPSRVTFCNPANPAIWTGTDFFDVKNGDGQPIMKIYAFEGQIAIFKTRSTYTYAYESNPAKGQVVGASYTNGLDGEDCLVETENVLYVMSGAKVYSVFNWNWEQLNIKVPFAYVNNHTGKISHNCSLSVLGFRIIARYYDTYYVMGTKTKSWSTWTSYLTPHKFIKYPIVDNATGVEIYWADNYLSYDAADTTSPTRIFRVKDECNTLDKETFTATMETKTYSFDRPEGFKRLMWWGVDLLANSPVTAIVSPVVYGFPVKWKALSDLNLKWIDEANYTWGHPRQLAIDVTDTANIKNFSYTRMFVKYLKSLRFRQIYFELNSNLDGSTLTGSLRIFSLTVLLVNKQMVSKKIN